MIDIIILGSGTLSPSLTRTAAGLAIIIDNDPLLFDSGSGIYYKLAHAGIDFHDITYFFYTHYEHPDHVNDLPFILFAKKYDERDHKRDIILHGPPGFTDFYNTIKNLYPILEDFPFKVHINEMHDNSIVCDKFKMISKPMSHGNASSAGYRIESEGKLIVYSGDTDYNENLVELAENADVLITECSFPEGMKRPNHLTPELAGRIAAKAGAGRLILTHFYPQCEGRDIIKQAGNAFSGEIIPANDMMRIKV